MEHSKVIQQSIDYIEENLKEKISLEDLARRSYLSKYYFHRVFHQLVGETVMEYIRKRRLTEAAEELTESNSKIVDIALKYQFSSQEAFSRAFKRMFKVSPREFRKAQVKVLLYSKRQVYQVPTINLPTVAPMCKAA